MNTPQYLLVTSCLLITVLSSSCKKDALDQPSSTGFEIPVTAEAFQALLDNEDLFCLTPAAGLLSGDQFYFTDTYCTSLLSSDYNLYTWQAGIYGPDETVADWNKCFEQITNANQVLANLPQLNPATVQDQLKGACYFIRAYAMFNLAQLYARPYDELEADTALGIPLHTSIKINQPAVRSTMRETYNQIGHDLQQAVRLLPVTIDKAYPNRPAQPAAYAMLARMYLSMRQYEKAGLAADSCLRLHAALTDYNTLDKTALFPFSSTHPEILYQSRLSYSNGLLSGLLSGGSFIDEALLQSYTPGDLRPALFFQSIPGLPPIKGSYYGDISPFTGLATNEQYLIRAECRARMQQTTAALKDLNTLLEHRYKAEFFALLQTTNADTALAWILKEREKELVLHGQRWSDIRRLNKEGRKIYLTRKVNGITYQLPPNSLRYVLPIPPQAIRQNPMPQNPR